MPAYIAAFAVIQVVLVLMHAAAYQTLAAAFSLNEPWLAWLFAVLSVTFIGSSILAHKFCNVFVKWLYRASMYWFGLIIFLYEAALGFFFSELIFFWFNAYVSPALIGGIWFGGFFLLHSYATWQTLRIKITRLEISLPGLPEVWRGKKVVFVSDLHLGVVRSERLSKKVVQAIRLESPEAVWIGGDLFDGVKCRPDSLTEPFAELHPPQGTFFITGNHEYINGGIRSFMDSIRRTNMRILHNEVVDLQGLQLAGVDWKETHHADAYEAILTGMKIDPKRPSVLLKHEPSDLAIAERAGVSLQLSGHTHGGAQIFPLRYLTQRMYAGFDYGFHAFKNLMVYTSSGVGTWGPPLRFGTKSEIVVITLRNDA